MSADEEYLDNLLNSMKESSEDQRATDSDIEGTLAGTAIDEDGAEWKASLDELLAAADSETQESLQLEDQSDYSLSALLDGISDMEGKFENTGIDDSFQNALGEMEESDIADTLNAVDDKNNIFDNTDETQLMNSMDDETAESGVDNASSKKPKKNKGKKKSLFSKKKKEDIENTTDEADLSKMEQETEKETMPGKSKGFFGRFFDLLLREDEEIVSDKKLDENGEILKELDLEDQADKKKNNKKEKKKKDKKDKEEEKTKDKKAGKKKAGRERKKEKQKEKQEVPQRKSAPVLNPKALLSLIAFCATIIAAVVLLSIFLPDYADKQNARNAFYAGDYSQVYELLYDKKLRQNDEMIFNRASTVLQLQRRLDSYDLNKKMGNEAEALDALLQGTLRYEELLSGDIYGTSEELMSIYQIMLEHLSMDFGISEDEAREINTYDSDTYTRKIFSVINGTEFAMNPEVNEEPGKPQDILPEEEEIIQMEMQ